MIILKKYNKSTLRKRRQMLNLLKIKIQNKINKRFLEKIIFMDYLHYGIQDSYYIKRWKILKRLNKFTTNVSDKKKFWKYLIGWLFLSLFKPTPKRLKLLIKTIFIWGCSIWRSSINIILTFDAANINFYKYIYVFFIYIFVIKFIQEVFFHFTCPLATLIYGKYVKREYKYLEKDKKKAEKERLKKLHKFVADPFYTKADKIRIQAEKDAKEKVRYEKKEILLIEKKKKWIPLKKPFKLVKKPKKPWIHRYLDSFR